MNIAKLHTLLKMQRNVEELVNLKNKIPGIKIKNTYDLREVGIILTSIGSLLLEDENLKDTEIYKLSLKLLDLMEERIDVGLKVELELLREKIEEIEKR